MPPTHLEQSMMGFLGPEDDGLQFYSRSSDRALYSLSRAICTSLQPSGESRADYEKILDTLSIASDWRCKPMR
jgi:hypothetical protein